MVAGSSGCGQSPAQAAPEAPRQAFEVVSIRPVDAKARDNFGEAMVFPSNRFAMRRAGLKVLIQLAYGPGKVSGGPAWVDSQAWSISAKVEGGAMLSQKQMRPLLQNLLAQRFQLKVHRVQTIVSGYALVVAPGGPKLQPAKGGAFVGFSSVCELRYQNDSVENFGRAIGGTVLKVPVADETGLDGMYDFDLKFVPDDNPNIGDASCLHVPDLFTAVQKELGLKLVRRKVAIDSYVIDSAERPSEN
jgi:uncharacterized protein (TIGR03435 family)